MVDFEVLVLGGGVAGVAAALAAAGRGRRTALVRAAPGATALASGAWRGPLPDSLAAALAAAGIPHAPTAGPLPHPSGALHACDYAAPAQHAAILEDDVLVCGIVGLAGFHAPALARLWGAAAGAMLEGTALELAGTPAAGWSPASLAALLDRQPGRLAEPLARAVHAAGARRVILPAVLGIEQTGAILDALADAAGVPVGEALGTPPSLPGWRLDRALLAALDAAGVEVIPGRAVAGASTGRRLDAVHVRRAASGDAASALAPLRVTARTFVLATGKFLAGGITTEIPLEEPVLGCPVHVERIGGAEPSWSTPWRLTGDLPAEPIRAPGTRTPPGVPPTASPHAAAPIPAPAAPLDPLALTRRERTATHPLLCAGVRTDAAGRPVDGTGDVVYENVRVAGSIRAGHQVATLGLGAAALDGWQAGERAAT